MSEKVTYKTLNSANVRVDNSVDTERTYDIAANANIGSNMMPGTQQQGINNVTSIDNGEVKRKGETITVATFSSYGADSLNINHQNTSPEEQLAVTTAVNAFIADVKAKANESSPLNL